MLAALGMFAFNTDSTLFEELTRRRDWRHQRSERFGLLSASQYTGPGDDRITINGTLVPEILGRYSAITTLASMADTGDAYTLVNGAGNVFGLFTINSLEEKWANLIDNGLPRVIGFTLELSRVYVPALAGITQIPAAVS
jgi:phage protein U